MTTYFQQPGARRWIALAGLALVARLVAFLPVLSHAVDVVIVISGAVAMGTATVGLTVLLGRHLRALGRLDVWAMPGLGIMLLAVALTNSLFAPQAVASGWLMTLGWVICTLGLVAGILGYMAYQDQRRAERRVFVRNSSDEEG